MNSIDELLDTHSFLQDDLAKVRAVIDETLRGGRERTETALRPFVETSGKMLRPLMVLLSARISGDFDEDRIHRLAAAVEILHTATLIHDDIVDESPTRRGIPSAHVAEGVRRAVLIGDFLFTRCFKLSADFAEPESGRLLANAVSRICESEMGQERNLYTGRRRYFRGIAGKTALLFMLAASIGARESGASNDAVAVLRFAGYGIGMSFQIRDDILDFRSDPSGWGKPNGVDLKSDIATLPLIIAREKDKSGFAKLAPRRRTRRNLQRLRSFVIENGGIDAAQQRAAYYTAGAIKALTTFPACEARDAMIDMARVLEGRTL